MPNRLQEDNFLDKRDQREKISEEKANRAQERQQDIAETVCSIMSTQRGRYAIWHLCGLDSVFAGPYTNEAISTAYACGQQIAALGMRKFIRECAGLELYQQMELEVHKLQD